MNKLKIFILLALVVSMVSCKHKPKPSNKPVATDTTQIAPVNVSQADMVLLNTLKKSVAQQDTFNKVEIKFNIDFRSETQSHSGSGTIRMIKDSLIWISISALGIEAGRALMTPDSVKFIFKLKNKYFAGDYSYLRRFLPVDVDFNIMQSIFLDQFFIFPKNDLALLDYFFPTQDGETITISTRGRDEYQQRFGINNTVVFDNSIKKMTENTALFASNGKGLTISYSDYKDFTYHNLPSKVSFNGVGTDFTAVFTYQKVTFGKKMTVNFSIPNNYKPFEF
ncbi:MAG: DUF4292 domain-containing protein [Bacteroidales bacterium]|nr:DUF4292 domain-containing protein [Bacteroidales bacterium]